MEVEYNCRNNTLDLGYHQNGEIKLYMRAHLVRTYNIETLVEELNDTFFHEMLHYLNGRISHRQMFNIRRAMIGSEEFIPDSNVVIIE